MLKFLCDDIVDFLVVMFNRIMENGDYPELWAIGLVKILHKKGKKGDKSTFNFQLADSF